MIDAAHPAPVRAHGVVARPALPAHVLPGHGSVPHELVRTMAASLAQKSPPSAKLHLLFDVRHFARIW
jgi:hypothetical protein